MRTQRTNAIGLAALILMLTPAFARAAAGGSGIVDEGQFFSADTIAKADQQIADIKRQFGKDLRVETYPQIPPDLAGQYSADRKDAFYVQWAQRQGRQANVDGVIVLITREP